MTSSTRTQSATRISADRAGITEVRVIAEAPIALLYGGIPHVVLMATPADLEDLAAGFSLTDGIATPAGIDSVTQRHTDQGIELDVTLAPAALTRYLAERRQRATRSYTSCGICGTETLSQLPQPQPTRGQRYDQAAIARALNLLRAHQPLTQATGAAHAAAWCAPDGEILLAREDVGRHNALDKLIGARARAGGLAHGFCLITSRCSYEMVQKASAAGIGLLVCISAPTTLAIDAARAAGLTLIALARGDTQTVYVDAAQPPP